MSERLSRLAMGLFAVLTAAVALNLVVLQPVPGSQTHLAARGPEWGAVRETAALAVSEIDRPNGATVTTGEGPPRTAAAVGERLVVESPATDRREIARAVQRALEARGYETGGTDGIAGPVTQAAILAYEIDHGLPLTAEPSEALAKMIVEGPQAGSGGVGAGTLTPGPKAETLIRSVQQSLARLGYRIGKADGRLGEATIAAIRQFERQQSMPDTGRISGELLTRLTRLGGSPRTADRR